MKPVCRHDEIFHLVALLSKIIEQVFNVFLSVLFYHQTHTLRFQRQNKTKNSSIRFRGDKQEDTKSIATLSFSFFTLHTFSASVNCCSRSDIVRW